MTSQFTEIVTLIQRSRSNAQRMVNVEMINLYWQVGEYIHGKLKSAVWGNGAINELADFIGKHHPELKGFSSRGLYRMKLFYEIYAPLLEEFATFEKLQVVDNQLDAISPTLLAKLKDVRNTLLTQISWSHHLILMEKIEKNEERVFYIRLTINENYSVRELERQIKSSLYERVVLRNQQLPGEIKNRENTKNVFKDSYVFEFLNLPERHTEKELQKSLIDKIQAFILEIGKDFSFIGKEYKVVVGGVNFYIDLLFYHRELRCLVVFELKTTEFIPEYLGKLNFYMNVLDRKEKKPFENPTVGVLLCKEKNNEIVEYALGANLSPSIIAEYRTLLPDKKLLQQKLHELFENELI